MSWQDTLSSAQYWINPEKNIEIKYFLFLYIYILDSALRDSAFLINRTVGRVPYKSSEVFQKCTKVYYCPSRPSELFIETHNN